MKLLVILHTYNLYDTSCFMLKYSVHIVGTILVERKNRNFKCSYFVFYWYKKFFDSFIGFFFFFFLRYDRNSNLNSHTYIF